MSAAKPSFPKVRWSHPLARGLVACWAMGEGSGKTVNDLSGHAFNGVLQSTAPAWKGGQSGWALDFTGSSNAQVDCGNDLCLSGATAATWAFWLYLSSTAVGRIVTKWTGSGATSAWELEIIAVGKLNVAVANSGGNINQQSMTSGATIGVWQHFAATFVAPTTMAFYLNGALVPSGTNASNVVSIGASTSNVQMGFETAETTGGAPMILDTLSIWNRALSAPEIAQLAKDHWCYLRPRVGQIKSAFVPTYMPRNLVYTDPNPTLEDLE